MLFDKKSVAKRVAAALAAEPEVWTWTGLVDQDYYAPFPHTYWLENSHMQIAVGDFEPDKAKEIKDRMLDLLNAGEDALDDEWCPLTTPTEGDHDNATG